MSLVVLVLHGLGAALLLGAVTHQAIAAWAPTSVPREGWWNALRAVHAERFATAIVVLSLLVALLGALAYPPFRAVTRVQFLDPKLPWATGLFEIKEHAAAVGLALLPAYWAAWREPEGRGRRSITTLVAAIIWTSYLVGLVVDVARVR